MTKLDSFTSGYIDAMLWSSTDDNDTPLEDNYSASDLSPALLESTIQDCARFQADNLTWIVDSERVYRPRQGEYIDAQAGHDFWLTRNHHGAGFWDGDWSDDAGKALTDASHRYPEVSPYIGDDGLIYGM